MFSSSDWDNDGGNGSGGRTFQDDGEETISLMSSDAGTTSFSFAPENKYGKKKNKKIVNPYSNNQNSNVLGYAALALILIGVTISWGSSFLYNNQEGTSLSTSHSNIETTSSSGGGGFISNPFKHNNKNNKKGGTHHGGLGGIKQYQHLKTSDINNWCMNEQQTKDQCKQCLNPLQPEDKLYDHEWKHHHEQNIKAVKTILNKNLDKPLDVIFIGDTIFSEWHNHNSQARKTYDLLFNSQNSYYKGLMLGMDGDTSPNLLYRLEHEIVKNFKDYGNKEPRVWWISIGTEDFYNKDGSYCSADVVIMGIKRIIEELRTIRLLNDHEETAGGNVGDLPYIIINSILPRTEQRFENDGDNSDKPLLVDYDGSKTLFTEINYVNNEIRKYIDTFNSREHIKFVDFKDLFLKVKNLSYRIDISNQYINTKLLTKSTDDKISLPTKQGYMKLGQEIFITMQSLLDNDREDSMNVGPQMLYGGAAAASSGAINVDSTGGGM